MTNPKTTWEGEFDDAFVRPNTKEFYDDLLKTYKPNSPTVAEPAEYIKEFIRNILTQYQKQVEEVLVKQAFWMDGTEGEIQAVYLPDALEKIKNLKP